MTSIIPIIIGAVFGGWALLALVGGERTRRVNELEAAIAAKAVPVKVKDPGPITVGSPSPPVSSKPAAAPAAKPAAAAPKAEAKPAKDKGKGKGGK